MGVAEPVMGVGEPMMGAWEPVIGSGEPVMGVIQVTFSPGPTNIYIYTYTKEHITSTSMVLDCHNAI